MTKILSVNAIENGTVIDHIPSGVAIRMINLLKLANHQSCVTIGLNLKSKNSEGLKDLIKIAGHHLTEQECNYVSLFAPVATINLIKDFAVIEKLTAKPPEKIIGLLSCANPNCISNQETMTTRFTLLQHGSKSQLHCNYCEKNFSRQEIKGDVI